MQAGLGGGSSDAAAALRGAGAAVARRRRPTVCARSRRTLGADVPFFLEGGTALGLERGDLLFPLIDRRPPWVVLVAAGFRRQHEGRVRLVGCAIGGASG